jgi:hypothetical protein
VVSYSSAAVIVDYMSRSKYPVDPKVSFKSRDYTGHETTFRST